MSCVRALLCARALVLCEVIASTKSYSSDDTFVGSGMRTKYSKRRDKCSKHHTSISLQRNTTPLRSCSAASLDLWDCCCLYTSMLSCAYPAALVHNISVRTAHCPRPTAPIPQIKRMVVELYDDTSRRYNAELTAAIRKAPIPIVFINCDIWQSKVSGEKFIGESALSLAKSSVAF